MTAVTAQKLLDIVNVLEKMISDIGTKQRILKSKIADCKSAEDKEIINDATLALGSEVDGINQTITLVEDLHDHLVQQEVCV